MLYLIGIGLGDYKDITVRGMEIIAKCDRVYFESYTSYLAIGINGLGNYLGKEIIRVDRDFIDDHPNEIYHDADHLNVAYLIEGDPFGPTAHTSILLAAKARGIKYEIIHNASIMHSIGGCGLLLSRFGRTVSVPFWSDLWKPDGFYQTIKMNRDNGMHTLCLLDIRLTNESSSSADTITAKKEKLQPKFMKVDKAAIQLLNIIDKHLANGIPENQLAYNDKTIMIGIGQPGHDTQKILATPLRNFLNSYLGPPVHVFIIPAKQLHAIESKYLKQFLWFDDDYDNIDDYDL